MGRYGSRIESPARSRRLSTLMAGTTGAELPASAANSGRRPIAANVVSWVASKLIRRSTRAVAGLDIDVGARSNADVIMGNFPKVKVSPPCRV